MTRVLKPGGGLVVTAAALDVLRGGHAGTWPEVRRYTTARMRAIVEGAGLKITRLTYLFATLFPMMLVVRALTRDPGPGRGGSSELPSPTADWEMRVPPAPVNGALAMMLGAEAAISRRFPMPAGSSVLVVARKP
jgi:hypothetical protein